MKIYSLLSFGLALMLFACSEDDPIESSSEWLIPANEVRDGGPGKDGIPALENPEFVLASEVDFLAPVDKIIGFKSGDEIHAYTHRVLDWHEIINDDVNGTKIAMTYCPLTGTAVGWDREINGEETTFGVSGLLYNTNLMPFDRKTDSYWSQMRLDCVNGELIGEVIETYFPVETTWETWQSMYPNSKVTTFNTGFSRNYNQYPYGDYRTNDNNLIFPISTDDNRLPRKDRVLGVIVGDQAKAYTFDSFPGSDVNVIQDDFQGEQLVVAGSKDRDILVVYSSVLADGTELSFSKVDLSVNALPVIMQDNEGNLWDIFGTAVSGPRTGTRLEEQRAYIGFWFSWGTFYPGLEIFE